MNTKKKVIVFDMDGVLFDTIPYARKVFMERHPGVTEEMYNEIHSGNFHDNALKYKHLHIKETEAEKEQHRVKYAQKKSQTPLFDGIDDLLKVLKEQEHILVVNTNAYNRNCLELLKNAGIQDLFDFIATAEVSKDKVEKFEFIKDKYKTDNNIIFVTDALGDVLDAEKVDIPTIAVTWGVHDRSFFERKKHKNLLHIADTVEELSKYI